MPDALIIPNVTPEHLAALQANPLVLEIRIVSEDILIRHLDFAASNEVEKQAKDGKIKE